MAALMFSLSGCDSILEFQESRAAATQRFSSPTGVYAVSGNNKGAVLIHWDEVKGVTKYHIYTSITPGVENNKFKSRKSGARSPFLYTGLTSGKAYYFTVTAGNGAQESSMSSEISVTAP
jgi:hypothetical protein